MDVAASEFMIEGTTKYDLNFKEKDNDGSQVLTGCAPFGTLDPAEIDLAAP
jgi:hypothetical protein